MSDNNKIFNQTAVLLVCIYNHYGNIITHDYLYQLFCPFGNIVKILIFEKAKVWKTFVEYDNIYAAQKAIQQLNNKIIFEDGSKMNIFRSKLKHIQLQNTNLGGVNYQNLKEQQEHDFESTSFDSNRKRHSTFQDYISPSYSHEIDTQAYFNFVEQDYYPSSASGKYKSQSLSAKLSLQNNRSINNFVDVDEQFRQIAMESSQFRDWEEKVAINRKKSKTIVNPNSQQFLIENFPSKVLFVRSLPESYDNDCIYNIFTNFGKINKVIFIIEKNSALVQFENLLNAIQAKDQINYAKPELKVFYSHYQSLIFRKVTTEEQEYEYKSEGLSKPPGFNPPSQVLYMTMLHPTQQAQMRDMCKQLDCPIKQMEWKQNSKNKWMCLVQFTDLNDSLFVMGKLQGVSTSNHRKIRLSFTRSRIQKPKSNI